MDRIYQILSISQMNGERKKRCGGDLNIKILLVFFFFKATEI